MGSEGRLGLVWRVRVVCFSHPGSQVRLMPICSNLFKTHFLIIPICSFFLPDSDHSLQSVDLRKCLEGNTKDVGAQGLRPEGVVMDQPLKALKQPQTKWIEMARTIWMIWSGGSNFIVKKSYDTDILILIPYRQLGEDLRIGLLLEDIWRYNVAWWGMPKYSSIDLVPIIFMRTNVCQPLAGFPQQFPLHYMSWLILVLACSSVTFRCCVALTTISRFFRFTFLLIGNRHGCSVQASANGEVFSIHPFVATRLKTKKINLTERGPERGWARTSWLWLQGTSEWAWACCTLALPCTRLRPTTSPFGEDTGQSCNSPDGIPLSPPTL